MEPNGPVVVHWVPLVRSLSYIPMRVHLVPNYHLAGDRLKLSQGPLVVPEPHFESQCFSVMKSQSVKSVALSI